MRRRILVTVPLATLAATLLPAPAEAHLVTTGLGPVYDGVTHLFFSADDLVAAIALALLAGLNGPLAGRRALFGVSGGWLLGGVAGLAAMTPLLPASATALWLIVLGALTATGARMSPWIVAAIGVSLGLGHGSLNGSAIRDAARDGLALAGIVAAVFTVTALASALVVSLRAAWTRIAVRVAGSWIAAIGLLMLGWTLRAAH
jgi:hydrogenase/urease accessory protein HupE